LLGRLIEDGWPAEYLFAYTFDDPAWGCNRDNADTIAVWIEEIRTATGEPRVDLVAHSMGTLSSRYYLKNLGGTEVVNVYLTMGGQHHGLRSPCFMPEPIRPCIWDELCETGDYIAQLNEDPATPGDLFWVSMAGSEDEDTPAESSYLDGAENITVPGVTHDGPTGLLEHLDAYAEILRVLRYPDW